MRRSEPHEFKLPWLIVCEGPSDRHFFNQLIAIRGIAANFDVQHPGQDGGTGGITKYGAYLRGLLANESFIENVKAVLITADNDDVPADSLTQVKAQLNLAGFPVPQNERALARKKGFPATVISMIPGPNVPGGLEVLCLPAAHAKFGLAPQIDALVAASPSGGWGLTKQSKTRLQAIMAATCKKQPDTSLARLWGHPVDYHFPLDNPAFDDLAAFLSGFGALLEANP